MLIDGAFSYHTDNDNSIFRLGYLRMIEGCYRIKCPFIKNPKKNQDIMQNGEGGSRAIWNILIEH